MKTYQEPVTEIIEVEAADVITTSPATNWKYDANGNRTEWVGPNYQG